MRLLRVAETQGTSGRNTSPVNTERLECNGQTAATCTVELDVFLPGSDVHNVNSLDGQHWRPPLSDVTVTSEQDFPLRKAPYFGEALERSFRGLPFALFCFFSSNVPRRGRKFPPRQVRPVYQLAGWNLCYSQLVSDGD